MAAAFQQRLQSSVGREKGKWAWDDSSNQLLFKKEAKGSRRKSRAAWLMQGVNFAAPMKSVAVRASDGTDTAVTLEHVKAVAVGLISSELIRNMDRATVSQFDECYRTDEMNIFLWATLLYFESFIENREAEEDESVSVDGVMGDKARAVLKTTQAKLKQRMVDLGREYAYFILGAGQRERHHSQQGRLKASKTKTDQHLYEVIYEFAMYVTWVAFNYEHWKMLHNELGRVFRTMAFNRDCRFSSDDAYVHVEGLGDISKTSDEYLSYRAYYDRPPLGTLNELKSPALVVFLPTPKDRNPWLYQHPYRPTNLKSPSTVLAQTVKPPDRLGVIGEQMSKLDPATLQYLGLSESGSEEEEEEEEGSGCSEAEEGDSESEVSGIIDDDDDGESECNPSH